MTRCSIVVAAALALAPVWVNSPAIAAPPAGGTIAIRPDAAAAADPAARSFVDAAGEALAARGFTILDDPDHAAYVAEMVLSRTEVGTGTARAPTGRGSVAPGGAYGSVGAGVSIPLPAGNSELVPLRRTQLELRIRKRGEDAVLWNGTAVTIRTEGTRRGADEAVASDLNAAILRTYPAEPENVVGVP